MSPRVRPVPRFMLLLATAALAGCGGDDESPAGDDVPAIDAAPPVEPDAADVSDAPDAAPAEPAPLAGDEYGGPEAFDHVGCSPGSLAGFDPVGSWNLDTTTDYGGGFVSRFASATRVFRTQSGALRANLLEGGLTTDVRLDANDLFVRRVTTDTSGRLSITALDACTLDADGSLAGRYVRCSDRFVDFVGKPCIESSFRGVRLARRAGEAEAQGLSLLAEWHGKAADPWPAEALPVNVRVVGDLAYVVSLKDGLRIVDLTDLAAIRERARFSARGGYNDVKIVTRPSDGRRFALCSSDSEGIDVIDVEDPADPTFVTVFPPSRSVHTLFTETRDGQTRVYFPDGKSNGLEVWDVTDPAAPARLGGFVHPDVSTMGGYVHDLSVRDGIAYLNYWNLGFVVVDARDPADITQLGQFDDYERRTSHSNWVTEVNGCLVAVHGDEDFGAHLRTIGVDPRPACSAQFMQQLGELQLRPEVSIHNIVAIGTTAYVAHYQDGVRLVDLANPAAPVVSRYFNTWKGGPGTGFFEGAVGIDVDLARRRLYVADIPRGLVVLAID